MRLLSDKGLLLKLFTQNIDCLERAAGVPDEKIVEAHGSFARQRCIDCHQEFPDALMKQAISRHEVPHCIYPACSGLVKPDIVFFGEALPEAFHRNKTLPSSADLAIVMGTSLTVQPFASLPGYCAEGVPRVLLNSERVGGLGSRADDVLLLGDCDEIVRKLASALGWLEELEAMLDTYNPYHSTQPQSDGLQDGTLGDTLDDEIDRITREVDSALRISSQHVATFFENPPSEGTTPAQTESEDKTDAQGQSSTVSQAQYEAQESKSDCEQNMSNGHEVDGDKSEKQKENLMMPDI